MAFEYFATQQVDIAVIETGLGGRLDSTNIITPILSVITNIGYDHMNILGNSLEEIAAEKAGIIKPGVPVVIGEYIPETKNIFIKKAKEMNAALHFAADEYKVSNINYSLRSLRCDVQNIEHIITESFELDLNGLYQVKNLYTVLCAEGILIEQGFIIKNEIEKKALRHVKKYTGLYGRWDVICEKPTIILDVAHNEDGIKQILRQLSIVSEPSTGLHFVMGMVKDKDITKVLSLLPKDAGYYFTNAHIPRAMAHEDLKYKAAYSGLIGESFDDVNMAINAAKQNTGPNDIIIVCGSVFVVAEVDTALFS